MTNEFLVFWIWLNHATQTQTDECATPANHCAAKITTRPPFACIQRLRTPSPIAWCPWEKKERCNIIHTIMEKVRSFLSSLFDRENARLFGLPWERKRGVQLCLAPNASFFLLRSSKEMLYQKTICNHITAQQPPSFPACGLYGSSFLATCPHTDGTI